MSILDKETVENIKTEVTKEVETTLKALEKGYPGITEGLATAIGSGTGAAGSLVTLSAIGKVAGLSAPGITSGLAAAGALVGGGMVAGIGVLAAPVAVLGVTGYAVAKKRRNAKLAAALATAVAKLYGVQERLMENAEYFTEELASIKGIISLLEKKQAE